MNAVIKPSHFWDHAGSEGSFSHRVAQLMPRVDYRRADSDKERKAIFRLRYQAYGREGAISAKSVGLFSDYYDDTNNAHLFAIYIDGELASSLRLHIGSEACPDFPSVEAFPKHLQPELRAGKVLVDTTRFVADERLSRLHRDLPYVTLRLCMLAAEYFVADFWLAAVRAEHQAFYRRAFNHRVICEPRPYPLLAEPAGLVRLHFPSGATELYRKYPFFRSSSAERRRLFEVRQHPAFSKHGAVVS